MKLLSDLPLPIEKYKQFQSEGWDSTHFLSVITLSELLEYFGMVNESLSTKQEIEETLQKIKTKQFVVENLKPFIRNNIWSLSTGIQSIDTILDRNGLPSSEITLFYGKFRSGKSQIAHQCCVQTYIQYKHLPSQKIALFIDTESTFRPERICQMSEFHGLPVDDVLTKIMVIKISALSEFELVLKKIDELITQMGIKFIAIDSFINHYRVELAKNTASPNKIVEKLGSHLEILSACAKSHNIPILCTSQVTAAMSKTYFFNIIPVLATTLNIYIKNWIMLAEDEIITAMPENAGRRVAHVINSQTKKEQNAQFIITEHGLETYFG